MANNSSRSRTAGMDPLEELARGMGARQKHHADYVKLLTERKNELLAAQIDSGPRSDVYRNAIRDLERSESQFERLQAVIRRPVNKINIATWVFWIFAFALAMFEAPINKFLFDYAIQGTNLTSYIISTVFAVMLLLLAHLGGRCLRQAWSEYRHRVVWSNAVISFVLVVVLIVLISILTIGRAQFSATAANPEFNDLFSGISGQVGQLGFLGSLKAAFSDISALVLFTVNLGGMMAAMLLGFFSHDPDKDFDHANNALQKSATLVAKLQKRYARHRAKIIRKYAPDLAGTSRNYAEANNRIFELKTLLREPIDEQDRFIIDSLDDLAREAAESEDQPPPEPRVSGGATASEPAASSQSKIRSIT